MRLQPPRLPDVMDWGDPGSPASGAGQEAVTAWGGGGGRDTLGEAEAGFSHPRPRPAHSLLHGHLPRGGAWHLAWAKLWETEPLNQTVDPSGRKTEVTRGLTRQRSPLAARTHSEIAHVGSPAQRPGLRRVRMRAVPTGCPRRDCSTGCMPISSGRGERPGGHGCS